MLPVPDKQVAQKYDEVASAYDRRWQFYVRPTLDYFTETLSVQGNERVLDVSCGTGELIARLYERYPDLDLVGVDLSAKMLHRARAKIGDTPRVTLREGNAEALPFGDDTFDVVVSTSAFHYYGEPKQALLEARRVLRPGGRLVLMDWNATHWLWTVLDPVLRYFDPSYRGCYPPDAVRMLLREAHFQDIGVTPVRAGWIWGMWWASASCPS